MRRFTFIEWLKILQSFQEREFVFAGIVCMGGAAYRIMQKRCPYSGIMQKKLIQLPKRPVCTIGE